VPGQKRHNNHVNKEEKMKTRIGGITGIIFLIMVSCRFLSPALSANNQAKDAKAYQMAYNLILEEKWQEAANTLGEFVRSYPGSAYVDDAASHLIRIGHKLTKSGKPGYMDIVQSICRGQDDDIKLSALYALEDFEDPSVIPYLSEIVLKESDEKLVRAALDTLEDIESKDVIPVLKKVLEQPGSIKVKKAALDALEDRQDPSVLPILRDIALKGNDIQLQRAAIDVIGDFENSESLKVLKGISLPVPLFFLFISFIFSCLSLDALSFPRKQN
jgi:hypothetical protein